MRDYLRSLPVFVGTPTEFDTAALPSEPTELFRQWLGDAVGHGVPEPHAMTLSTCDADGQPDARVLILKDLDEQGWWFATNADSAKGDQLAKRPAAALTFYWPVVARQVRIRGPVKNASTQASSTDFLSRGSDAKAVALVSAESKPLESRAACELAVAEARQRLARDPRLIAPTWQLYFVAADTVEFWQGAPDRMHVRVQYRRQLDHWDHTLLWP
ncbi:MAG: pyridoxal 5'-phosphate synthase [Mycobacterium sp.]